MKPCASIICLPTVPRFQKCRFTRHYYLLIEGVLDDGCLVSTLSSISIGDGETPQPIHADDQVVALARPHQAIICNSMWAITDFTEANGATRIVPNSHKDPKWPEYGSSEIESIPAEMKRGSILVWHGSLWHGGGANHSGERRVGIAANYCAGFLRQQENQQLGVPRAVAAEFPERLQRMLGYGVYRNSDRPYRSARPARAFRCDREPCARFGINSRPRE